MFGDLEFDKEDKQEHNKQCAVVKIKKFTNKYMLGMRCSLDLVVDWDGRWRTRGLTPSS